MTRKRVLSVSLAAVALVAVAAAVYFLLVGARGGRYALPECGQLPSVTQVEDAIRNHATELDRIRTIDPAIMITPTRPCRDAPDRGAILITVPDQHTADQVSQAMATMPALGVPSTIKVA